MDVISDLCLNKAYIKSYLKSKLSETLCYCKKQEDTILKFSINNCADLYEVGSVSDVKSILDELEINYEYSFDKTLNWGIRGFIPNSNLNRAEVIFWVKGNLEHSGFQVTAMITLS